MARKVWKADDYFRMVEERQIASSTAFTKMVPVGAPDDAPFEGRGGRCRICGTPLKSRKQRICKVCKAEEKRLRAREYQELKRYREKGWL